MAEPAVRNAINVGNLTFHSAEEVEKHLRNDIMDTVKPWMAILMDNYKVFDQENYEATCSVLFLVQCKLDDKMCKVAG